LAEEKIGETLIMNFSSPKDIEEYCKNNKCDRNSCPVFKLCVIACKTLFYTEQRFEFIFKSLRKEKLRKLLS